MIVNSKKMVGSPVRTASGQPVGKLVSIDLDAETGRLAALQVRFRGLGLETVQIAWSQVIEIRASEIIVTDTAVSAGSPVPIHRTA